MCHLLSCMCIVRGCNIYKFEPTQVNVDPFLSAPCDSRLMRLMVLLNTDTGAAHERTLRLSRTKTWSTTNIHNQLPVDTNSRVIIPVHFSYLSSLHTKNDKLEAKIVIILLAGGHRYWSL